MIRNFYHRFLSVKMALIESRVLCKYFAFEKIWLLNQRVVKIFILKMHFEDAFRRIFIGNQVFLWRSWQTIEGYLEKRWRRWIVIRIKLNFIVECFLFMSSSSLMRVAIYKALKSVLQRKCRQHCYYMFLYILREYFFILFYWKYVHTLSDLNINELFITIYSRFMISQLSGIGVRYWLLSLSGYKITQSPLFKNSI